MVILFNCELSTFHQLYRLSKLAVRAHTGQPIICDEMLAIIKVSRIADRTFHSILIIFNVSLLNSPSQA